MIKRYNVLCETVHIETPSDHRGVSEEVSIFHLVPRQPFATDYSNGFVEYRGQALQLLGIRSGLGGAGVVLCLKVSTGRVLELYTDTPVVRTDGCDTITPAEIRDRATEAMSRQDRFGF